jgi:hypothetical protein
MAGIIGLFAPLFPSRVKLEDVARITEVSKRRLYHDRHGRQAIRHCPKREQPTERRGRDLDCMVIAGLATLQRWIRPEAQTSYYLPRAFQDGSIHHAAIDF